MKKKKINVYIADFETTVYSGQEDTKVWAAAIIDINAPNSEEYVSIYGSIEDFMKVVFKSGTGSKYIYFHNLKFDGSFIMQWILKNKDLRIAGNKRDNGFEWWDQKPGELFEGTYKTSISDKGMWYSISVKLHGCYVEFRDSLKLLPFSVKTIGSRNGFNTEHKKLEMEYTGIRFPNCKRTAEEDKYIANDVLVVKEALQWMFSEGHKSLTIGGCCLTEYKRQWSDQWEDFFPDLYVMEDKSGKFSSIGEYIRRSYHGGWCYCVPERAGVLINKDLGNGISGTTADVNSLYPSMMHSKSGNVYPIGKPNYFKGNIPEKILNTDKYYYFIRIICHFEIKPGFLPCVQIKGNLCYPPREWLFSSDAQNRKTKETEHATAELILTQTDFEMLQKHYNVTELEIIDGYYFRAMAGIFDQYIDKYAEIKKTSKGAMRTLAKLFLNNLYGKFATSTDSSFKICYLDENGVLKFSTIESNEKKPGYIPIGSAITSYARRFTITAAQKNYHPGERGFIYADTDSIHCDLLPDEIKGAPEHATEFNHWKYESCWSEGWFVGAKRYAELHTYEDREKLDNPVWDLKCAGMGQHSKDLFIASITGQTDIIKDGKKEKVWKTEEEEEFVNKDHSINDFQIGLTIPGTLKARQIPGGVLLINGDYKMHPVNKWI